MTTQKKFDVYVLLDEDRIIKYVGCTGDPERREAEHLRSDEKGHLEYEVFEIFDNEEEALEAEENLMRILYLLGANLMNVKNMKSAEEGVFIEKESEFWRKIEKIIREEEDFYFRRVQIILEREKKRPGRLTDEEKAQIDRIFQKFTRF